MNSVDFWNDKERADNVISSLNNLKKKIEGIVALKDSVDSDLEMLELLKEEDNSDIRDLLMNNISSYSDCLDELEVELLLDGDYDDCNCILEVHAGAGGTEACDWANMLYRMYTRWCEKNNYKYEVIDYLAGEEVGVKSVTISIKGVNSYGYLKSEKGIHRLVRLSPFDSNHKRHTSFASVEVIPEIKKDIDVVIEDKDLKIDVYRSSGAGGQHVNTTDSAVRITHLPTNIVVTCQNGRSQIQNREEAMMVLKSKLKLLEIEKQNNELNEVRGEQKNIEFGSQIRSYVLHPYSMIKDHRTNVESSNVDKILDGDIDIYINAYLKRR
jgi:peptide chain release factor 2